MSSLSIRKCSDADLELLAVMNKQLIEDEEHDNKMDLQQLQERMYNFIHTDYDAYIFEFNQQVIGYALVNVKATPLYLRQYFISREFRRSGFGTTAFYMLLDTLQTKTIDIEVLVWNKRARRFWGTLGFKDRSISMRHTSEQ